MKNKKKLRKMIRHLEDDIREQRKGIKKDKKSICSLKKMLKHEGRRDTWQNMFSQKSEGLL